MYAGGRDSVDVVAAVGQAVDRLRASPPGSRLYIVRSHMNPDEDALWHRAFDALGVVPREDVVGIEPLLVLDRSAVG